MADVSAPDKHDHSGHDHADRDHSHDHSHRLSADAGDSPRRALKIALAITAGFAIVEAIGGWMSGSLALLSDAGHMIADAGALGLALFAAAVARRPASARASYGYGRAEVLAAFVNAIAMLAIVALISIEAVKRILDPVPVAGGMVVGIALTGLAANIATAWVLSRASESINTRGALLHVMSDLLGSLAAIIAGGVIMVTGWMPIDPILSIVVSVLILRSTWRLLKQSTGVLLDGVPTHLDYEAVGRTLAGLPGVQDVHDLHIWTMSADGVALSAHVAIASADEWPATLARARRVLVEEYKIAHVTLQPTWPMAAMASSSGRVIPLVPVAAVGRPTGHEH
ncbi:MAG: cation diffusion facilitator family transporter [Betaproteobacteria bacterium]